MRLRIPIAVSIIVISAMSFSSVFAEPITNVGPTPHSTYYTGNSYTTIYAPSEISPPNGTKPPVITITSMVNDTVVNSSKLTLTFDLILESPSAYHPIILQGLCYRSSWQSDNVTINIDSNNQFVNKTLTFSISFSNILDGAKSITLYASTMYENETGRENKSAPISGIEGIPPYGNYLYIYSNYYFIEGSSNIDFIIDTSPSPSVPEFSWLTTLPLLLAIPIVLVMIRKRILSRNSTNHS